MRGSRGLDAGCGAGTDTLKPARMVGADGHGVGLDISDEFIECGRPEAEELSDGDGTVENPAGRPGSLGRRRLLHPSDGQLLDVLLHRDVHDVPDPAAHDRPANR